MTPTDNERGVWAWHRKSAHERFSILLLNEYMELGKHHHNLRGEDDGR